MTKPVVAARMASDIKFPGLATRIFRPALAEELMKEAAALNRQTIAKLAAVPGIDVEATESGFRVYETVTKRSPYGFAQARHERILRFTVVGGKAKSTAYRGFAFEPITGSYMAARQLFAEAGYEIAECDAARLEVKSILRRSGRNGRSPERFAELGSMSVEDGSFESGEGGML